MSLEPRLSSLRKRKAHRLLQQSAKDILNMPETVLVRRKMDTLRFFLVGSQCTFRLSLLAHPQKGLVRENIISFLLSRDRLCLPGAI
jgi:hypothetical protein